MKNIQIITKTLAAVFAVLAFTACSNNDVVEEEATSSIAAEGINISTAQFQKMGLELGELQTINIAENISANGMVDVPPENIAEVSYPTNGFIKTLTHNVLPGKYVSKGAVLATAQSMEIIQLQQDYLEKYTQRSFLAQELERQKALVLEDAGAKRRLQEAEGNYKVNQAMINALEAKLNLLGLPITQIQSGNISNLVSIKAPFAGYVQKVNIHTGSNFIPSDVLFELISKEHLHVELKVFEKDAFKLKEGQTVVFNDVKIGGRVEGKVFLVGKNFESDSKAINVHVHLSNEKAEQMLIPGQYLNGQIRTDSRETKALPEAAILREGEGTSIFKQTKNENGQLSFQKVKVEIGSIQDGMAEILSPLDLSNVVIRRVNFLAGGFEEE
ncbi:membrane fusion protein, cobalt-zinc-cadmium efflux system [Spirosomataceae bacterium TFI 002]|nr:membrane fusion protein, cobalt-zinc-cadmium efflux system [Spirosomataceae bacterium TFI 002]